jgi:lipopolysaccharide assembly protein A
VLTLIFAIILGLGFAFFATQNTNGVTITFASIPLTDMPVWVVVIVSLLIGLVLASYFNVVNLIESAFKIRGKDATIKGSDKKISALTSEVQSLKAENANLRSRKDSE